MRFSICLFFFVCLTISCKTKDSSPEISFLKLPLNYIQPKVDKDQKGNIHLICYSGEPGNGDIFYGTISENGNSFSSFTKVNDIKGTAVSAGTIRGAQLAIGKDGTIHVVWNGSGNSKISINDSMEVTPLLYTRSIDGGKTFEPSRNIIKKAWGLDGGSSITADHEGNVFVIWHAPEPGKKGEENRRVWMAQSINNGEDFSEEKIISDTTHGVCACCGLQTKFSNGELFVQYRNATKDKTRDMRLISIKNGISEDKLLESWPIDACPMSSNSIVHTKTSTLGAWESAGLISYSSISTAGSEIFKPLTQSDKSRHPSIAVSKGGYTILAWSEGTGWNKGGDLAWEITSPKGEMFKSGKMPEGIETWNFPSVITDYSDNHFIVVY